MRNLLALAIGVVLAFVIGEGVARFVLPPPPIVSVERNPALADRLADERGHPQALEEPDENRPGGPFMIETPTGLRLRASTSVRIAKHWLSEREIHLRTNALGYRNPEIGPKTRRRVLFLGDSITLGEYVDEDETFVRLVERLSAEGEPLETINAGVNLIGLQEELAILVETGLRTEPDVVVLDMYLNDVFPSPGVRVADVPPLLGHSWFVRDVFSLAVRLHPAPPQGRDFARMQQQWDAWSREIAARFPPGDGEVTRDPGAFNRLIALSVADWGSAWADGAWAQMAPVLAELRRQADAHGFALYIVLFPVVHQVEANFVQDFPQQKLAGIARTLNVPVLDLLPLFRTAHRQAREPIFYDRCHPTPYGNRLVARWILDFLRAQMGPARPAR